MTKSKHKALGRGLDALFQDSPDETTNEGAGKTSGRAGSRKAAGANSGALSGTGTGEEEATGYVKVRITEVEPNKSQPRTNFDKDKLEELADSIKTHGLMEPLIVQKRNNHYEIISGERRWRAAKLAGLKEVPVIVQELSEKEILEWSLIENIQRENLNPVEEAKAYQRLIDEFSLTQDEVAGRLSKSRTAVTNTLRLLKLCNQVQAMLVNGRISAGHARALIVVEDPEDQYRIAQEIVRNNLSVRDTEKLIRKYMKPADKDKKTDKPDESLEAIMRNLETRMKDSLGTKVKINSRKDKSGKIEIEYYNHEELDRITQKLLRK